MKLAPGGTGTLPAKAKAVLSRRLIYHRFESLDGQAVSDLRANVCFSNRPSGVKHVRLSTTAVSMSLTGSCFSSESAPRPFHHGIRRRGGTI